MKRVMVFGVFDNVHEGHRHFLKEAKKFGDHLIAVVTPDEVVRELKGKNPTKDIFERVAGIEGVHDVDEVIIGDEETGSWNVIRRLRPEVIVTGYDQHKLKAVLKDMLDDFNWFMEIETVSAHEPHKYSSSILNKRYNRQRGAE